MNVAGLATVGFSHRERLHHWWLRRLAASVEQPLPQRQLFLIPTRFGLGWAVLVVVLLLFGINYQNNLAYGLAFWLFSVGVVVVLRGWLNLLGVTPGLRLPREAFAGSEARLGVVLKARSDRTALELRCDGARGRVDIVDGLGETELALPTPRRGIQALPLLRVETRWPLGLVRVVAWVRHDAELLVWPHPVEEDEPVAHHAGAGLEAVDFAGLRRFQPGDSPGRVAWKQWSRTGVLTTKVFSVPPRQQLWLDYEACRGDPERRLSVLCARVLAHHQAGDRYGLRLPGLTLAQGEGEAQRRRALDALARFPASRSEGQA
ncbi:DUF58 domain-containing protein [Halomonas daqiaonensis]|uniref:Uncharacterized conserved protein, DUF58 family, contains vWF domain n=1 Tax=Halomonas daqiaonensis TaxID=650850 RepID=A0A1H7QWE6_9GAMM|nr:DUF58 domain-containing protein [Halomonas daqiaonensis]SEL51637.1 Uncharacterized conserved protein, DUF58 family, contains vWF domain [Halomonas daqiaonensis]